MDERRVRGEKCCLSVFGAKQGKESSGIKKVQCNKKNVENKWKRDKIYKLTIHRMKILYE